VYLKHFGFREAPFNLTPDPKFFFDSPFHREAWASVVYGINNKKGFVVVTGEVGTGKTTLIRKVLRSLEATHHSVFIFNTRLTFDELLETILRDLDLNPPLSSRVAMLEALNDFLLQKVKAGHVVSIVIDEAQNLSEDALEGVRLLSNMETDREKLLQIILVGQPELDVKLNSRALRQLKQRVTLWCKLDCLSEKDAETYIRHRLKVAGYEGPDLFDRASLSCIWEDTSGIPRLINAVCDNALVTAFATNKKMVSVDIIQEAIRDLRIKEAQRLEMLAQDDSIAGQSGRDPAGAWDGRIAGKSGRVEDQDVIFGRQAVVAAAELASNPLFREFEQREVALPQSKEQKRHQARPLPSVAEVKEKRPIERGRVIEIADSRWPSRPNVAGGEPLAPSRNFRNSQDDLVVSPAFFEKICAALIDGMGPMASVVIHSEIQALGECFERFPVIKLHELVQKIKGEILNDGLRAAFETKILREIEQYAKSSGRNYSGK
jgi:general secretion pathway protein A